MTVYKNYNPVGHESTNLQDDATNWDSVAGVATVTAASRIRGSTFGQCIDLSVLDSTPPDGDVDVSGPFRVLTTDLGAEQSCGILAHADEDASGALGSVVNGIELRFKFDGSNNMTVFVIGHSTVSGYNGGGEILLSSIVSGITWATGGDYAYLMQVRDAAANEYDVTVYITRTSDGYYLKPDGGWQSGSVAAITIHLNDTIFTDIEPIGTMGIQFNGEFTDAKGVHFGAITYQSPAPLATVSVTPTTVLTNSEDNEIELVGTGTDWDTSTPTITVDAGTITGQTINSDTSITLTYDAPATEQTVTFTDPSSGEFDTVEIVDVVDVIVDDAAATIGGFWNSANSSDGYGYGYRYIQTGFSSTVTYPFPTLPPGTYNLYVAYPANVNRATNVPVTLLDSDGTTVLSTLSVNQEIECLDVLDSKVGWRLLGTFTNTGTGFTVELSSAGANEYTIADAFRVTNYTLETTCAITKQAGDFSDDANWVNGILPTAGNLNIVCRDDMVISEDTTLGDGTAGSYLVVPEMATGSKLTVHGAKLTLRIANTALSDDALNYAGPMTEFLEIKHNGSVRGHLSFDCNAGVTPVVNMGYRCQVTLDGTPTAPFLIETDADSLGGHGYFKNVGSESSGGSIYWGHDGYAKGVFIGEIYRIGDHANKGFECSMPVNAGGGCFMRNVYWDSATCGILDINCQTDVADVDMKYCRFGNFDDIPLGSHANNPAHGICSIAASVAKHPSAVRQLIGNDFNSHYGWGVRMVNYDFTIKHNCFFTTAVDTVDTPGAFFEENLIYVNSPDNAEAGMSWNGDSLNNFILGGLDWCNALGFQLNRSRTHTDNVIQVLTTAGPTIIFGPNDGGTNTTFTYLRNLVLPYQPGGGGCLAQGFHSPSTGTNSPARLDARHNTVHTGTSPNYAAFSSWSGDSGTPQTANLVTSIKSNIVISDSASPDTYLFSAVTALTAAALVADIAPALSIDFNAVQGLKNSPAGSFSGVSGDTGISDGTPCHSPMTGAIVPNANGFVLAITFYDSSRNFLTYATTVAGSASGTMMGKVQDAFAYISADPETRIPALNAWIKDGWRVTNIELYNAGHDGVTVGALPFAGSVGGGGAARRRRILCN